MKKIISVIIITMLLIAMVVSEQIFVHSTLDKLIAKIDTLTTKIDATENINSEELLSLNYNLDKFWTENEKILCLSINHNDLNKVGEQIKKMIVYAEQNRKDDYVYELETLKFYAESYKHVMEISPQNLL